jgi:chemotaxis protein CheC
VQFEVYSGAIYSIFTGRPVSAPRHNERLALELKLRHREVLSELINIGYGRAANALSQLAGERIVLEAPQVELRTIDRVKDGLNELLQGEVSSVHQVFSGPVSGHALLLLNSAAAETLTSLIVPRDLAPEELVSAKREALMELGNVVLQASMGICGNILQVQVSFSVPKLHLESINDVLDSLTVQEKELQFALLVRTRFQMLRTEVSGYLIVVLGVTSYSRLLEELDNWERRQVCK